MEKTIEIKNFEQYGSSDIGNCREKNEDYFGYSETVNGDIFVVCDGIGGNPAGEIASKTAVNSIIEYFKTEWYKNPISALRKSFENANDDLFRLGNENSEYTGLGTTAVAVLIRENKFYFAHIGDSRIYFSGGNKIFQITEDHSFVQQLVNTKTISPEEAQKHSRKNEITRALGISEKILPQISAKPFFPTDNSYLLLCSDGLCSVFEENELSEILFENKSIKEKSEKFIEKAIEKGSDDNITVQIIHFFNTGNSADLSKEFLELKNKKAGKKRIKYGILILFMFFFTTILIINVIFSDKKNNSKTNKSSDIIFKNNQISEPVFGYSFSEKDTFIDIYIENAGELNDLEQKYNISFEKTKTGKIKSRTKIKIPIKEIRHIRLGNEIFPVLTVNHLKYEDLLRTSGKKSLYFNPGEKIIIPLSPNQEKNK
jgi:protein phosphatase